MVLNYTPHTIIVEDHFGSQPTSFESVGSARVEMQSVSLPDLEGFEMTTHNPSGITGLPEPVTKTYLIVSAMVLSAGKELGRKDLIAPNTNSALRNEKGHIMSVPGFVS